MKCDIPTCYTSVCYGGVAELVEGARLEIVYAG